MQIQLQENSAQIRRMIHWQGKPYNGQVASCISDFSGPKGMRFKILFCQEVQISGIKRQTH